MKKISAFILAVVMLFILCACGKTDMEPNRTSEADSTPEITDLADGAQMNSTLDNISENFVLISGGTFQMGSLEGEAWRSEDEAQHTVTVSDFYMSIYELTQAEYEQARPELVTQVENMEEYDFSGKTIIPFCSHGGGRFGAVMENDGSLYITAADTKAVYRQMKENPNIQIVALKLGTREWIRISGTVEESTDIAMKQKMLDECEILSKHYSAPTNDHFCIFKIQICEAYIVTDEGRERLV